MVIRHLKKILKTIRLILRDYSTDVIPLNTLNTVLSKAKLNTKVDDKFVLDHNYRFNEIIDSVYTESKKIKRNNSLNGVPYESLKVMIDTIIEGYKRGNKN